MVAIRCLDEGIDIPYLENAIILASSQNPREFIQRRGRILRKSKGKTRAIIHDFVVMPPTKENSEYTETEKSILAKELERLKSFEENNKPIENNVSSGLEKFEVNKTPKN